MSSILTDIQKRRYEMHLKGMSLAEIAKKEGCTRASVQSAIKRAKELLENGSYTETIAIKIEPSLKELLVKASEHQEITISEYVRQLLIEEFILEENE